MGDIYCNDVRPPFVVAKAFCMFSQVSNFVTSCTSLPVGAKEDTVSIVARPRPVLNLIEGEHHLVPTGEPEGVMVRKGIVSFEEIPGSVRDSVRPRNHALLLSKPMLPLQPEEIVVVGDLLPDSVVVTIVAVVVGVDEGGDPGVSEI